MPENVKARLEGWLPGQYNFSIALFKGFWSWTQVRLQYCVVLVLFRTVVLPLLERCDSQEKHFSFKVTPPEQICPSSTEDVNFVENSSCRRVWGKLVRKKPIY